MTNTRSLSTLAFQIFTVVAAACALLSCSSDNGSGSARGSKADAALFALVPNDCEIMMTANLKSHAAEELRQSPLAKLFSGAGNTPNKDDSSIPTELPGGVKITAEQAEVMASMERIAKNPLLAEPSKYLEGSVLCVGGLTTETPGFIIISKIKSGASITPELATLESDLRAAGHSVTRSEKNGGVMLTAKLSDAAKTAIEQGAEANSSGSEKSNREKINEMVSSPWFLIAANDRLVVASTVEAAEKMLAGIPENASFAANKEYIERVKLLNSSDEQLGLVYFRDPEGFDDSKAGQNNDDSGFFIGNAAYVGTREKGSLRLAGFVTPNKKGDVQARLAELASVTGISGVLKTNLQSVFSATINAKSVISSINKNSPQAAKEIANLPEVSEVTVGLALPSGASPFPDVYGTVHTADPALVLSTLKLLLDKQQMLSAWKTQTIAGTEVQLALSPMGVGAFLANLKDKVVFATSQSAMEQLIAGASANSAKGSDGAMFRFVINGKQVLALTKAMQGTLSMFMGGKAAIDLGKWQALEQLGDSTINIKAEKTGVRVDTDIAVGT